MLKLKEIKPDVIVAASYVNDVILFQKQAKQYALSSKAFIGVTAGCGLPDLAENLGKYVNGVFVPEAPAMVNWGTSTKRRTSSMKRSTRDGRKRKEHEPVGHAYRAFAGTYAFLAHILPKTQSVDDTEAVREALL